MAQFGPLPCNLEAERVVLGSLLISPEAAELALASLTKSDFSGVDERNVLIFEAVEKLHASNRPIDAQTVMDMLVNLKYEKASGGNAYVFSLLNSVINPDNIDYYIDMVKEQALLRELLLKTEEIQKKYAEGVPNISEFIVHSNDEIAHIAQKRNVRGMRTAAEIAEEVSTNIENQARNDRSLLGVTTGYKRLDKMTHGWQKGDMIILAARPSVGKTALGMNFAFNAAKRDNVPVAFFSLEMSAPKIMERLVASRSFVSNDKIQTGMLNIDDRKKIFGALKEISETRIYFDDSPNAKLGDIVAKAQKLKSKEPDLGLIVIDYLGRIRYFDKADASARQQEVSYISGELKTLARTLNVPVLVLCQLNRNAESNDNKVPSLSNLRESGSIEQDADIVMLMYREDYYTNMGQTVKKKSWAKNGQDNESRPEEQKKELSEKEKEKTGDMSEVKVNVAKNRNGQVGTVTLFFQKAFSLFSDPSPEYEARLAASGVGGDDE
ncbi:MAG: replicative DNA helicase [Bacilli bacterium]|nr:replicative DNA helicase [Bacilli bacterium]